MTRDVLTNPQIVTVAVALLGGQVKLVDREDIAVTANELAPGRFVWRKYPTQIDLDSIGVALRDAKKPRNGALLVGDNVKGWMLTPAGVTWVSSQDLDTLQMNLPEKSRRSAFTQTLETERTRLQETSAFRLYSTGKSSDIGRQDFFDFARVNEYFGTRDRERRFHHIDLAVRGNPLLENLWTFLKEHFTEESA